MKKILTLLFGLSLIFNVYTQSITVTGFNNITDVNGNSHSLSSYLNDGKFVLLNFYLESCGNCMATAPKIQSIYNDFGENQCRLIVLNVFQPSSPTSTYTNQQCITWMSNNGCPGPPNFNSQSGISWYQFYSAYGGGFAQSYLISPVNNSVIFSHAGGVLNAVALRSVLNSAIDSNPSASILQNGSNLTATSAANYVWNTSATTQTITPTANGLFWCVVTDINGCIADTAFYQLTTVAINEIINTEKKLLRMIDVFGQETPYRKNTPLFFIYNDGTIEKKIVFE